MSSDNFEKVEMIKKKLGPNYLKKLELDPDVVNKPAYEFADEVCNAFEEKFPSEARKLEWAIQQEYEEGLDSSMTREEAIEDLLLKASDDDLADIYMDDYKYGRCPRSKEFRNCREVILNVLIEKRFANLSEMIAALRIAPGSYIGPYNYKRLLNHIMFAVKSRIIQYYLTRGRIAKSGKCFYYTDPSRFHRAMKTLKDANIRVVER